MTRLRCRARLAASLTALALGPNAAGAQQPVRQQPAAPPAPAAALGVVHGVVYDSLTRRPLAGAAVQIVRAGDLLGGRTVAADSSGTFRIDSLAPGRYLVGFYHPLLDLLRVDLPPRPVEIGPGGAAVLADLGVPALDRLRPLLCGGPQAPADSTGLLAGRVRDAADDAPVAAATVVLTWSELVVGAGGVRTEHHRVPIPTDPGGTYLACGVPADVELAATVAAPGRAGGPVAVEVPQRGFVLRDFTLGDTGAVVARGTARLTGTVRDPAARPVRGARVFVWSAASATTVGDDGTFALGGLPAGTRTLEVRAIGFAPRRVAVDLAPGRAATVDVRMDRTVAALAPVTVFGTPAPQSPLLREFLDRQRHSAFGRFLTAQDIARTEPVNITKTLPALGLQLVSNGHLGTAILGRTKRGEPCPATVVLDGAPLPAGDDLDQLVRPDQVAGIEVYTDATFAPPQYFGPLMNDCSVVLVWTGR